MSLVKIGYTGHVSREQRQPTGVWKWIRIPCQGFVVVDETECAMPTIVADIAKTAHCNVNDHIVVTDWFIE